MLLGKGEILYAEDHVVAGNFQADGTFELPATVTFNSSGYTFETNEAANTFGVVPPVESETVA